MAEFSWDGLVNGIKGMFVEGVLEQQDPRLKAFYDGLGAEQQQKFLEMAQKPEFQALMQGGGGDPAKAEGLYDMMGRLAGTEAANALVDSLSDNPDDMYKLLGVEAPAAGTEPAAPGGTDAKSGFDLQQLLGDGLKQLMDNPVMAFIGQIMEKIFGVSLQDMVGSAETLVSGAGPSHDSPNGPMAFLKEIMDGVMHVVDPDSGQVAPAAAAPAPAPGTKMAPADPRMTSPSMAGPF